MNLLELRYFRTAAQLENFSKTAEHHLIPQSAVSSTIKKLEKELDCQLFERKGKSIKLNENGRQFLITVDQALSILDEGINSLRKPHIKGIGINIQSGIHFMTYLVPDFEKQNPDIKLFFLQGNTKNKTEADFTFFQLPINEKKYSWDFLMDDEIMVAVHKEHALSKKELIDLKSLSSESFITYDSKNKLRKFTDSLCKKAGFDPSIAFETGDIKSLRSMVEAGLGIALVPSTSWRQSASDHTRLIPLKNHPKRTLVLAHPKDKQLTPEHQLFLNYTCNWFHNLINSFLN